MRAGRRGRDGAPARSVDDEGLPWPFYSRETVDVLKSYLHYESYRGASGSSDARTIIGHAPAGMNKSSMTSPVDHPRANTANIATAPTFAVFFAHSPTNNFFP